MNFIYDRNILDINYVNELMEKIKKQGIQSLDESELSQWNAGLRGMLNYTDLNRIEGNTAEIAVHFPLSLSTKINWTLTDLPTTTDYEKIRGNVELVRGTGFYYSDTPEIPQLPLNHYQKINDIEKILYDVETFYNQIKNKELIVVLGTGDSVLADEDGALMLALAVEEE